MNAFAVLLADGGWIGLATLVAFIILSFLTRAVGQYQEAQKEAMRRARKGAEEAPQRPSDSLEDEIAEFLRRAAERKTPGQAERPKPPQVERPAPPAPPISAAPREEALRPFRPSLRPVPKPVETEDEAIDAVPVEPATVAEHVQERFRRPRFSQIGSPGLGEQVALADDKVDQRLREKFGHGVSRLAAESGEAASAVASLAAPADRPGTAPSWDVAAIAALLTNPATLRQTILMSEILRRPEERWR